METHLNALSSKVNLILSKLKPALKFLNERNKKIVISSKVKPVALYGVQLMLGQNQQIMHKAQTLIMRINRYMTSNPEGLKSSEALCKSIGIDEPLQEILKSNFKLIHKMIKARKPQSIMEEIKFPSRSCRHLSIKNYPL